MSMVGGKCFLIVHWGLATLLTKIKTREIKEQRVIPEKK